MTEKNLTYFIEEMTDEQREKYFDKRKKQSQRISDICK